MTPYRISTVITIDFETLPIAQRPNYPPCPVGVAIKWPREAARYWAWGHPGENNCRREDAFAELERCLRSGLPLLFHNAKFDLAVLTECCGHSMPGWEQVHDTMFLAYLCDPHARSLGLKPLAEDLLGWPPEERDELGAWVWDHRQELEATYGRKVKKSELGAWIFAAPGALVGRYAIGDVERTAALFGHLLPLVVSNGMSEAYARERQCLPIFLANEREGMRVDETALGEAICSYRQSFERAEDWLRSTLQASGLNFDADADVASVLLSRGIVPESAWALTRTGKLSTSKDNLHPSAFTGPRGAEIASALGYRNRLKTCLSMFMEPWAAQAAINRGYITTNWNQVRSAGQSGGGTRTGRPSTENHNFLNLSKSFDGRDDGYEHPNFLGVAPLPLVRRFVLPDEGHVFLHRDFKAQEMRVFAHFEQGALCAQFNVAPDTDPHDFVSRELTRVTGREVGRGKIKVLNFQALYGGGVPALQRKLRCTIAEARDLKAFHDRALPGRKVLNEEIARIVRRGMPIRTWGGRLYFVEPPGYSKKHDRFMTYEYKLINYLVQGSAADLTKQALIDWHGHPARGARFLVTVYDEINISAPADDAGRQMEVLREAMDWPRLSVPMLSDGKWGRNWGDLSPW